VTDPARASPGATPTNGPLRPERFVAGGESLARDADGRVVFVRGGIPGDEVSVLVVEHKGDWSRATVTHVHAPSPDRVEPPCPYRGDGCGGCDWQHVRIGAQLPAKVEIVRDALRRTAKLPDAELRTGAAVDATGYRTTLRVVGDSEGRASFRIDRSHDTVAITDCMVAHPSLHALLGSMFMTPGLDVTLRTSVSTGATTARWDRRLGDVGGLPDSVAVGPSAHLYEDVAGHRFRVSAASFFQSGPAAAQLLVDAVRRAAPELAGATTMLDAYAGVGLFALAASGPSTRLITVETSKSAVADCRANLVGRDTRIELGEFGSWRPERGLEIGVVVADPSRSGLGRPGVAAVAAAGAPVIVLVSCDPVALARDASLLAREGYRHDGTEVFDLFPHTHHVECVTRFVRH
jgi:23S rRNA (uracil1939-C5)-methyltransferase